MKDKIFLKKKNNMTLLKNNMTKQQYGCDHYKNLLENEKQKLTEYRRKYYRTRKDAFL